MSDKCRKEYETLAPCLSTIRGEVYAVMKYDKDGEYVKLSSAQHQSSLYEMYYDKFENLKQQLAAEQQKNAELEAEIERLKREQAQSWISINERLPEDGQEVLYVFKPFDTVFQGKYDDTSFVGRVGFAHYLDVSYWMPIPTPPGVTEDE